MQLLFLLGSLFGTSGIFATACLWVILLVPPLQEGNAVFLHIIWVRQLNELWLMDFAVDEVIFVALFIMVEFVETKGHACMVPFARVFCRSNADKLRTKV